ncbi:MAG: cytochrome c oxidase subunit 3 [Nitrospinota bacterium]|jgi:heme/copper-type cytochrome/quinol oxidase subunit 3|nr:cytochrome c oxidase subunit 3 [Nitrospinota bacterium]
MSPAQAGHMATETAGERLPPLGKTGIWWFLASEIVTFGGLIGAYLIYFWGSGRIQEPAAHLSLAVGSINTLILLTSSLTMVLSHAASGKDDDRAAARWLSWTLLLGLAFLVIKGFEWTTEIGAGFTPAAGIFWSFYYIMTGLHGLHVLGGVVVNALLLRWVLTGGVKSVGGRIEYGGLYWHFVDLVWIFLFPLLYLT